MDDRLITALQRWRDEQVRSGVLEPKAISDAELMKIVVFRATSEQNIANQLRPSGRKHAADLTRIVALGQESVPIPMPAAPGTDTVQDALDPDLNPAEPESEPVPAAPADLVFEKPQDDLKRSGAEPEPPTTPEPDPGLDDGGFNNNVDYETPDDDVARLIVRPSRNGFALTWPARPVPDGEVAVYRVVANDEYEPYRPDSGRRVTATLDPKADDPVPQSTAVRYYQVWQHTGTAIDDAADSVPVKVARGEYISPVLDFTVITEHGQVRGTWRTLEPTERVRVYRTRLIGSAKLDEARDRILADSRNLSGFTDVDVTPGHKYLYRAVAEVDVGSGVMLSAPEVGPAEPEPDPPKPVLDLSATRGTKGDKAWLDLEWTRPPSGRVVIYRTNERPPSGLTDEILDEAQLNTPLPRAARVDQEPEPGERSTLRLPWPRESNVAWTRVYLTPVTLVGGKAQVGHTVVVVRPAGALQAAKLVERCDEQLVTFAWPDEADEVRIHVTEPDGDLNSTAEPIARLDRHAHRRDGGIHLGPLPPYGGDVHLVPVTISGRRAIAGTTTTLRYPGLLRVWYQVGLSQPGPTGRSDRFRRAARPPQMLFVRLRSTNNIPYPMSFVLVYRADRLPLSQHDGDQLRNYSYQHTPNAHPAPEIQLPSMAAGDSELTWFLPTEDRIGYVRLFAATTGHTPPLVVLDPPVHTLCIAPEDRR